MKRAKPKSAESPVVAYGEGIPRGRAAVVLIVLLFAAGACHWILFLHYGDLSFKAHDWGKEFIYYSLIKQSLGSGQIPYHISLAFHGTPRFLALPETNLSPQVLLLAFMGVGRFVMINTLILYSAGFLGCLLLMRRYRLSIVPFAMFFLVFNFNGHITAHLGVGHSMWAGYFLLPLFFLFLLELIEERPKRTSPFKLAFILFAILLQGGFHIFVWCITFLILVLIFNWRLLKPVLLSIGSTVLLSAFRLVPAMFALLGKKERFIWSYPTLRDLFDALITIRQQTPERLRPWGTTGWWEYDVYIGIIAVAIIVYLGIYLRFSKREDLQDVKFGALDMPVFVMGLFSLSYFHAFFTRIPLPLIRSERVATRFIIIPVLLLMLFAAIRLERLLRNVARKTKFVILAAGTLVVMALGFVDHSFLWSVARLERINAGRVVDLTIPQVVSQQDALYKGLLWTGVGVTAATAVGLAILIRRRAVSRGA
jgi:hypothetical protein